VSLAPAKDFADEVEDGGRDRVLCCTARRIVRRL
jgi:hypothetical protein